MDWLSESYVRELLTTQNMTFADAANHLQACYPGEHGLSERNLRRFCHKYGIAKRSGTLSTEHLNIEVSQAISEVGPTYGRRMMKAHLKTKGIDAAESRIAESLKISNPFYHAHRQKGTQRQLNPIPYYAPYFGYNLHMDQNEKMAEFGVTFVISVDGCSNYIPSFAVMPRKNNLTIYTDVFRLEDGVHYLCAELNNRVERMWSEINQRVGYPIKYAVYDMEREAGINRYNEHHAFAISQVCMKVAEHGINVFVNNWNTHKVSGKEAPVSHVLSRCTESLPIPLPSVDEARKLYESQGACELTEGGLFGIDQLPNDLRPQRNAAFVEKMVNTIGPYSDIFGATVNHQYDQLQKAISLFLNVTDEFL